MTNEETTTEETPEDVELEDWNNSFQRDETIGEALDQIVIDAGIEDLPKKPFTRTRHKRRGTTVPKFRKRLLLARAQAETVS
jgi:hypothetical protein